MFLYVVGGVLMFRKDMKIKPNTIMTIIKMH